MDVIVMVVVAFLASGTYNWASDDVKTDDECKATAAHVILERMEQNATEDDKVVGFAFRCDHVQKDPGIVVPKPAPAPKKRTAGRDEA